jgi:hypothetical protein
MAHEQHSNEEGVKKSGQFSERKDGVGFSVQSRWAVLSLVLVPDPKGCLAV